MSDLVDAACGIAGEIDNNRAYPKTTEQRSEISTTLIQLSQRIEELEKDVAFTKAELHQSQSAAIAEREHAQQRIEELEAEIARINELGYAKYLEQKFTKTGSNGFGL